MVLQQYKSYGLYPQTAAPSFNQHGGAIPDGGFDLVITNENAQQAGVVYYTLDGTDPRLPDGTVSPLALISDGSAIPLTVTTLVRSRTLKDDQWSAINEARFYAFVPASADNLVIAELNYNPYAPTQEEIDQQFTLADSFEFVELRNTTTDQVIDLTGVQFIEGITFDFTDGQIQTLEPGASVVIVKNELAFALRYGDGIDVAGQYTGKLANGGEALSLFDRFGQPIAQFSYDDSGSWPGRADGDGATLELADVAGDFSDSDSWRNSSEYGGSPGTEGAGWIGDVVINEVLTHTDLPKLDGIELLNTTDADIDLGGWFLSDSVSTLTKYRIPDGTILNAGAYIYFDERNFNPSGGVDPTSHPNDFGLNGDHGDDVWLTEADPLTGKLIRFVDHVGFDAAVLGETFGRWPNGEGDLIPMITPTLSNPNSGPRVGPVIFSEVHYNPGVGGDDLEFVEIYNPTSQPVDLTNWRIRGGIDFDFADGTTLDARSPLVILPFDPLEVANSATLAAFLVAYSIDASVPMIGGYDGKLDNGGELIELQRAGAPPVDEPDYIPHLIEDQADYNDNGDWPLAADGFGSSLNRMATDVWGNDPASWTAAVPTPGTAEIAALAEVVGRYVFYNNSAFDGNDGIADMRDDLAIAPDKQALLPGETATLANYTNFSRGLNGLMIDFSGLADAGALSAADDFEFRVGNSSDPEAWTVAPDPLLIDVRSGDGVRNSDRITIRFADNAIERQWLQVTVRATPNTGLTEPDVFYFGNAIGESGDQPSNAIVNATDEIVARNFQHGATSPAKIDDPLDYNRDGLVNGTDQIIARGNQTNPLSMLRLIEAPIPVVGFVAFNDHIGGPGTDPSVTTYDARPGGIASGPLLDVATGEATGATLTITESGVVFDDQRSGLPAPGTDAYDIFNAYIDFTPAAADSIEIQGAAGDYYTHTFSGLDRGDALNYAFAGTVIRGSAGYTDRWTQVTLVSAVSAAPAHSEGVVVISPTEVALMAGANHEADQGFVAAWTDIDPGADGAFSIVSTHYMGAIPGGTASQNKSYGLVAIRLEAVPVVASKQATDAIMAEGATGSPDTAAAAAWLYEFEQTSSKSQSTSRRSPTD
ncbi:MAG TPA: lamin tail domain-containing protein, partial [Thermoguttaceae bacterium]|nr:lamin tail domain-containing protein [Thermoguttaceae bacterium]